MIDSSKVTYNAQGEAYGLKDMSVSAPLTVENDCVAENKGSLSPIGSLDQFEDLMSFGEHLTQGTC